MGKVARYIIAIAICLFVLSYSFYAFWQQSAEIISVRLRSKYLGALLSQEIQYFEEELKVEELPS